MSVLRRRSPGGGPSPGGDSVATDPDMAASHPCLWEFLTLSAWDDGVPRTTGTLLVFCDAGRLKACLTDRDASESAFVSASSWASLLSLLEGGLQEQSLDWRAKQQQGGKRR